MTNNKFYNEIETLSVYIANLDEYVKGNLMGDWISLPIKKLDFRDFLFSIGNPEKVKILDYKDNLGLNGLEKIKKYKSLKEMNQLAKRIKNIDTSDVNTFNALYEALEDLEQALDYYETDNYVYYGDMTLEEIAQENIKEYYDIPEGLENYIDYRLYARDMDIEGLYYKTTYGTIEML